MCLASSNMSQPSSSYIIDFQCAALKCSLGCSYIDCKTVFLLLKCNHSFAGKCNCLIAMNGATQSLRSSSFTSWINTANIYRMRKQIQITICESFKFTYSHIGCLTPAFSFSSLIPSANKSYVNHSKLLFCEMSSRKFQLQSPRTLAPFLNLGLSFLPIWLHLGHEFFSTVESDLFPWKDYVVNKVSIFFSFFSLRNSSFAMHVYQVYSVSLLLGFGSVFSVIGREQGWLQRTDAKRPVVCWIQCWADCLIGML